jgi:hypothetical protein
MRQYVIDELRPADHQKLKDYLETKYGSAEMGGIYWIPIAPDIFTSIQREHDQCRPFYFAVDLESERIALELLVRTKKRVRCSCIGYASKDQRNWIIDLVDSMFEQLEITS